MFHQALLLHDLKEAQDGGVGQGAAVGIDLLEDFPHRGLPLRQRTLRASSSRSVGMGCIGMSLGRARESVETSTFVVLESTYFVKGLAGKWGFFSDGFFGASGGKSVVPWRREPNG